MAFAMLLGLDGSPLWQVARVLLTLALTTLAVWFTRRAGRTGRGTAALLRGIAGTVGGAGVAGTHPAKAGLDAAAVLERGSEWVQYTTAGLLSGAPCPASIPGSIRAAAPGQC